MCEVYTTTIFSIVLCQEYDSSVLHMLDIVYYVYVIMIKSNNGQAVWLLLSTR